MPSSGNFMTFNRLAYQNSYSASYSKLDTGNLRGNASAGGWGWPSNFSFDSGKWYCEFYIYRRTGASIGYVAVVDHYYPHIDAKYNDNRHRGPTVADYTVRYQGGGIGGVTTTTGISNNQIGNGNESQTFASDQWQDGDVIAVALDLDSSPQTVQFYRNGSAKGNAEDLNSSASGTWAFWAGSHNQTWFTMNAGQDSTFAGNKTAQGNADGNGFGDFYYSPPSGFLAPCSANLPISSDIDPAQTDDDYPSKQFNAITWTGNGSTQNIQNLNFQPDLVWYKRRDSASGHILMDSTRGTSKALESNNTGAEDTSFTQGITAFGTDGFSLGNQSQGNASGGTYVGWCWRANGGTTSSNTDGSITSTVQANTKAGFSIITFTSPNSSSDQTVGHGLSQAPEFIISKNIDSAFNWDVFHKDVTTGSGLILNLNNTPRTGVWGTVGASTIGTKNGYTHSGTDDYVYYAWHSVDGYSKFGRYDGNGNNDGTFIYTGFRPRMWFFKEIDNADDWAVYDTARDTFNRGSNRVVRWESTEAEFDGTTRAVDVLSNGLKIRTSNSTINASATYIFGAWGDVPFKYNNTF